MKTQVMRPGLLVVLRTVVQGNKKYSSNDLGEEVMEDGSVLEKWKTECLTQDPKEYKLAIQTQGKMRALIMKHCAILPNFKAALCPTQNSAKLDEAIKEAQELARVFNASAKMTQVGCYAFIGQVMADDEQALRAINKEMQDTLLAMEEGVRNLDAEAIRDAVKKVQEVGKMLNPEIFEKLKGTIEAARQRARMFGKAGEQASVIVDRFVINKIRESRTAFLDIEQEEQEVAMPEAEGRSIDLEMEPVPNGTSTPMEVQLELE